MSSMSMRRRPGNGARAGAAVRWVRPVLAALLIVLAPYGAAAASDGDRAAKAPETALASAIFAGGCFWCMEPPFDKLEGVVSTTAGYTGGRVPAPTYAQVTAGGTGHFEAIRVVYDPKRIDYGALLNVFWRNVDPLDAGGQFCDRGDQYRSAIFFETDAQKRLAERSKAELENPNGFGRAIATPILPASSFYEAEDYHQDYYQKNPLRYNYYRFNCGRDRRLDKLWGDANAAARD
jgi:peptide-methionine (S)-S-oxide reductase